MIKWPETKQEFARLRADARRVTRALDLNVVSEDPVTVISGDQGDVAGFGVTIRKEFFLPVQDFEIWMKVLEKRKARKEAGR